ncbi:MAG TPA: Hpt domain-containing protein [Steroidobacter sp.]|uniref:Hpt domain-containing protein n=1 Tax=Steroidobacter sp. TaxID=1978227 RepID=UPI002EDACFA1
MKNAPVLDREHLFQLTEGDMEFEHELLATFRASVQLILPRLRAAVSSGDSTRIMREAHALKGASLNVGATAMGRCAGAIEEALRAGDMALAAESTRELDSEEAALWAELDRLRAER